MKTSVSICLQPETLDAINMMALQRHHSTSRMCCLLLEDAIAHPRKIRVIDVANQRTFTMREDDAEHQILSKGQFTMETGPDGALIMWLHKYPAKKSQTA